MTTDKPSWIKAKAANPQQMAVRAPDRRGLRAAIGDGMFLVLKIRGIISCMSAIPDLGRDPSYQGAWTEEQYLVFTDHTNRLIEFTDGCLEPLPMPTDRHQAVLAFMFSAFHAFLDARGGKVRFSPLRLQIRRHKFREPDLLLLLSAADPRRQNRFWTGADLTLEVVSPDKPERDLVDKRFDYAEGRVPEYWIVNPETETITVLRLQGEVYVEAGNFRRGESARSTLLDGFDIDVSAVFDAD